MIPSAAAEILREADRRELLGSHLLVVGTNAVPAYFIEAGGRIVNAPAETDDFDLAWTANESDDEKEKLVWTTPEVPRRDLHGKHRATAVQARNAKAYGSQNAGGGTALAAFRPIHHACRRYPRRDASQDDGTGPAMVRASKVVAVAAKEKRDPLKRPKDFKQGVALLDVISDWMPQFKMDDTFRNELPQELRSIFDEWRR